MEDLEFLQNCMRLFAGTNKKMARFEKQINGVTQYIVTVEREHENCHVLKFNEVRKKTKEDTAS